ncbi:hypothetical protein Tco_0560333, partial [Tanacetum coccineum]
MEGDSECEEVPETKLADESPILNSDEASVGQNVARSEDPFESGECIHITHKDEVGSKKDLKED